MAMSCQTQEKRNTDPRFREPAPNYKHNYFFLVFWCSGALVFWLFKFTQMPTTQYVYYLISNTLFCFQIRVAASRCRPDLTEQTNPESVSKPLPGECVSGRQLSDAARI